ncbi:MAG: hypothetical protein WAO78_14225 [Roseovarius sp.]
MDKIKMIALGCGTLAIALGAGHFIQSGASDPVVEAVEVAPADPITAQVLPEGQVALEEITMTAAAPVPLVAVPTPPAAMPEPEPLPTPEAIPVALDALQPPAAELPQEEAVPAFSCEYLLSAEPFAGAMVTLSLDVTCMPNERFTLHHNGMMFSQVTDESGSAEMLVPALSSNAVFIVAFPNGEGAVATADVTSLGAYERAVMQWKDDAGLALHALEFGAEYGSDGHVSADAPRDAAAAATGNTGFMTRLGDPALPEALLAEVYTFPAGMSGQDGNVALTVEASVTETNCGRDIEAQSLQLNQSGALKVQDVTLAMPECDAVGEFLVLKNLLNDLTLARN